MNQIHRARTAPRQDARGDPEDLAILIDLVDSFDRRWRAAVAPESRPTVEQALEGLSEPLRTQARGYLHRLARELQGEAVGLSDGLTTLDGSHPGMAERAGPAADAGNGSNPASLVEWGDLTGLGLHESPESAPGL